MTLSFGDIPQELQEMRKNIKDNTIKKLYSNFNFQRMKRLKTIPLKLIYCNI